MMKAMRWHRVWLWVLLSAGLLPSVAWSAHPSVSYTTRWVAATRAHVITANLNDRSVQVRPALARSVPGRGQSFLGFLAQYQPLAQITGSYFSLSSWAPIGDIVIDGRLRYQGVVGSALVIRADNTAKIVNIPRGWRSSWPGYEMVLRGGVRLVQGGVYAVYPKAQGFRDPALFRQAMRTAVGLTADRRLLLVAVGREIQLSRLAAIMKGLGCRDAMSLDGGTSTGLAYGNSVIFSPGRLLSNVLMIIERPAPPPPPPPKRVGLTVVAQRPVFPWPTPAPRLPAVRLVAGPTVPPLTSMPHPIEQAAPPFAVVSRADGLIFTARKVTQHDPARRRRFTPALA